jgi:hypothetical protein
MIIKNNLLKNSMKTYFENFLKVLFILLLVSPILGAFGIFPPPTRDMYQSDAAFLFIQALMDSYLILGISLSALCAIVSVLLGRTALGMLFALPLSVCVIGFHATLDGGLFTGGAIMGNILFLIVVYFMWKHRAVYNSLLEKK